MRIFTTVSVAIIGGAIWGLVCSHYHLGFAASVLGGIVIGAGAYIVVNN